jgi:hypothetical protein
MVIAACQADVSAPAVEAPSIDPDRVVVAEPVDGSDIPVHLAYIETVDGLYTPIGIRKPEGDGPFPMILFASGNGGGGMTWVRDATRNRSWTQERFVKAGYAVAWTRYRAEVELAYHKYGKLVEDVRQGRQLLNRGPLEYEDMISIIEYVKTLPYVDPDRVGYMGMSHGGEMAFKITSEYDGLRAAIASEPANHEFLALTPDETAHVNPESGLRDADAGDGKGSGADRSGRCTGANQYDQNADLRSRPQQRRIAGHLPCRIRTARRGRQGNGVEDLRARRPRFRLCGA